MGDHEDERRFMEKMYIYLLWSVRGYDYLTDISVMGPKELRHTALQMPYSWKYHWWGIKFGRLVVW